MSKNCNLTSRAYRYITGESENICRLCFGSADDGMALDDSWRLQCPYYDDTVTFRDIFVDLGITIDPGLPQMLCTLCADSAINAFFFQKLYHNSCSQWLEALEILDKTLDLSETLPPTVKSTYFVIHNDESFLLKSRNIQKVKNKGAILKKVKELMKARKTYYGKTKKKPSVIICEECGKKFPSKCYLERHMGLHRNKKYSCTYCPKVFPSKSQVQDHMERIHKPKVIECPKCDKRFATSKILNNHDSHNHQPTVCKCCSTTFPSKKSLQQHLNQHNIKKCPRCNKEFSNKYTFKVHLKICGNNEEKQLKFFCDICNKGYCRKNGLKSHLATDHGFGRVYTCDWCNKPFNAPSKLKNHTVKHTRERNYSCHECGSRFVTQAALVYHVRIHTGEKPFPCDLCGEKFLSASRRMEHKKRKHFGPNRQCSYCHSTFFTKYELKKHVARHKNPQSRLFLATDKTNNRAPTTDSTEVWEERWLPSTLTTIDH